MTDDTRVPPHVGGPSGSTLLRVQASSKLAFVATTAALVTLASGGTAVLVSHGTGGLSRPSALRAGSPLTDPDAGTGAVVVERAPGTYAPTPAAPLVAAGRTAQALPGSPVSLVPAGSPTRSLPVAVPDGSQAGVPQLPLVPVGPPPVAVLPVQLPDVPGVPSPTTISQGSHGSHGSHGKVGVHARHLVGHARDSDHGSYGRAKNTRSKRHPS